MARRYSGNLTVYLDVRDDGYTCRIVGPHGSKEIRVGFPNYLERAVDSPEAIDAAARAAISFADAESPDVGIAAEYDDGGIMIFRKPLRDLLRRAT